MSYPKTLLPGLDLGRAGGVDAEAVARQTRTAEEILKRYAHQPGLILADEVGMGKTFVALAAAVSAAKLHPYHKPAVVMAPPGLTKKWRRDFIAFKACLPEAIRQTTHCIIAESGTAFLRALDDPEPARPALVIVAHGTLTNSLRDPWLILAICHFALKGRHGADEVRRVLSRQVYEIVSRRYLPDADEKFWFNLLATPPQDWKALLLKAGIKDDNVLRADGELDDPVPEQALAVLNTMDLSALLPVFDAIPRRESPTLKDRQKQAKTALRDTAREAWQACLRKIELHLPLLILDEAHHVKNGRTRLASLFSSEDACSDGDAITKKGMLGNVFDRMLFLTATPFQLGHHELLNVLERFRGINWQSGAFAPELSPDQFKGELDQLARRLDAMQYGGERLDRAWSRLKATDLILDEKPYEDTDAWWDDVSRVPHESSPNLTPAANEVILQVAGFEKTVRASEEALRPWVIRHLRDRKIADVNRRVVKPGIGIDLNQNGATQEQGLAIEKEALFPFLLAARAVAHSSQTRPVFAEGLCSSFGAFLETRSRYLNPTPKDAPALLDTEESNVEVAPTGDGRLRWYIDAIEKSLPHGSSHRELIHPKVRKTVEKAVALWERGEKVLIFCHYILTGRRLRECLSQVLQQRIQAKVAGVRGISEEEAGAWLHRVGERISDLESPAHRQLELRIRERLGQYPALEMFSDDIFKCLRRMLRTPSFIVRYLPLHLDAFQAEAIDEALQRSDDSGFSLEQLLVDFFEFLTTRRNDDERRAYLKAALSIKTGIAHLDEGVEEDADLDSGIQDRFMIPNVRLVNGATKDKQRDNWMLAFNTPFYPDILVASAVMAEGVDLHVNCRFVIHHDLCWNPSTLEQRNGRVDRLGGKVERARRSIEVYYPYLADSQDEKMYRVVMDRERWFKIAMGDKFEMDPGSVEKVAERLKLPEGVIAKLSLDLSAQV